MLAGQIISPLPRRGMIELIQFPYSPFCIVARRILDYAGARYKLVNIPNDDRSLVWRLTRGRYYQVPVIKDGKQVIFELGDESQVVAKYLDGKFQLGLFPHKLDGVQRIIWRHIETKWKASPSSSTTFTGKNSSPKPGPSVSSGTRNASSATAASITGASNNRSCWPD
jgi:glutaredoxin